MNSKLTQHLLGREYNSNIIFLILALFMYAVLATLVIVHSLFSLCLVSGNSMNPTLQDGQYVTLYNNFTAERGDVIVFESEVRNEPLIKRVVATAGDTVELRRTGDGYVDLYVNGEYVREDYIKERMRDYSDSVPLMLYPDVVVTVPEGHLFVLGDNRNNSTDSRYSTVGFVDEDSVLGELAAIVPPGNITEFFVRLFMGGF